MGGSVGLWGFAYLALGCETFARVRMSVRIGNSAREIRLVRKQLCCATPSDRNSCEGECKAIIQGVMGGKF